MMRKNTRENKDKTMRWRTARKNEDKTSERTLERTRIKQ